MTFHLRYAPDTDLGRRFPHWRFGSRRTWEAAEATRRQCASAEYIEIVKEDES